MRRFTVDGRNIPLSTVDSTGKCNVVWYNWSDFLKPFFTPIHGISQYHHFRFDCTALGVVFVKEHAEADEMAVTINSDSTTIPLEMPLIITPVGMSRERQAYLYEKIRPFCSSDTANLTCPKPQTDKTTTQAKPKSNRKCSHCRQTGHTKTNRGVITCPQLL